MRLDIAADTADLKPMLERRAALAALARTHIEALRGSHLLDEEDDPVLDQPTAAFTQAKAQGPPN